MKRGDWETCNFVAALTANGVGTCGADATGSTGDGVARSVWPASVASTLNAHFGEKQGLEDQHALHGAPLFVPHPAVNALTANGVGTCGADDNQAPAGHLLPISFGAQMSEPQTDVDLVQTLQAKNPMAVAYSIMPMNSGTDYKARETDIAQPVMTTPVGGNQGGDYVVQPMAVDVYNGAITGQVTATIGASGSPVNSAGPQVAVSVEPYTLAIRGREGGADLEHRQDGTSNAILTPSGGRSGAGVGAVCATGEVFHALTSDGFDASEDGTGRGGGAVAVPMINMQGSKSNAVAQADGPSYTLAAMHGHDVHAIGVAYGFNWQNGGGYGNANDGLGITEEGTGPLQRSQHPAAAVKDIAPTLRAGGNETGGHRPPGTDVDTADSLQVVGMRVRRLTPTECERLQGFPDGWTQVPYRNKPASDGPRYKAIGNSMAVPVMRWIGQRLDIAASGLV